LKAVESRISTATEQKGAADVARFKGIITMYEGMKPKDAAKAADDNFPGNEHLTIEKGEPVLGFRE